MRAVADRVCGTAPSAHADLHKSITLTDLAKECTARNPQALDVLGEGSVGSTYPNGCHIAEVEVDPETGVTEIVAYNTVDDCGNVINHAVVDGQIHGAVVQGAGQVLAKRRSTIRPAGSC